MTPHAAGTARARPAWLLLVAIALIAVNMRGPFVAVAPLAKPLSVDLALTPGELGLLTGIPVLCFALASPLASLTARRLGAEMAVTITLLGVLAGVVIRSVDGTAVVMLGTVLLGVAITIVNIAVPLIIRRDFTKGRQGMAMGVYTAALNVGSFVTSVATAPLAEATGWRVALAGSAVFAAVAAAFWAAAAGVRALRPEPVTPEAPTHDGAGSPPRRSLAAVTVALLIGFGGQAFSYYGVTAWLPSLLSDELGLSPSAAGAGASLFQIIAILGALGTPILARYAGTMAAVIVLGVLWISVPVGLLVAPELWPLWSSLGGAAQGGGITLIFTEINVIARDQVSAGRMSAIVQGVGYALAAAAPTLLGWIHAGTGSWDPPLAVVVVSVVAFLVGTGVAVRMAVRHHR
ncbi:MFS transporter [Sinomonas cellulolyticus]|uniref:MFS transporter n=1 Tax=Sinomonas cellulolyticus TaxID=2801916 RepID=A0ABS1K2P3_9MICC|nr:MULTISPECIES: MFS transporter [Sinomonas]MBL0705944.1 MFS transporter [Sinomonas cellulolyticus]GHG42768.1 MFS transporter [Sinomonas sp. KCTC 49339]